MTHLIPQTTADARGRRRAHRQRARQMVAAVLAGQRVVIAKPPGMTADEWERALRAAVAGERDNA